jgi:hypothetical protein
LFSPFLPRFPPFYWLSPFPAPPFQAGAALQPYGEVISKVLTRAIDNVSEAVLRSCGTNAAAAAAPGGGGGGGQQQQQQQLMMMQGLQQQQQRHQQLASETTQEGLAAAALVDVMLQVRVQHPGKHRVLGGFERIDQGSAAAAATALADMML